MQAHSVLCPRLHLQSNSSLPGAVFSTSAKAVRLLKVKDAFKSVKNLKSGPSLLPTTFNRCRQIDPDILCTHTTARISYLQI